MYFIDKSFFHGEIFIPNLEEYCDNMNFDVLRFISQYETECLTLTLGECLFSELKKQLRFDETKKRFVLKDEAESRWEWLINGLEYDKAFDGCGCYCHCDRRHWRGFIYTTPIITNDGLRELKYSFLAYWIYFQRAFSKNSHSTGTGEAVNNTENATMISNEIKRKYAFNQFYQLVQIEDCAGFVSLYQFLKDHRDFYPEWCPTYFQPLNYFDI